MRLRSLTLASKAKMADGSHQMKASTQASRSRLWDTVTNRYAVLRSPGESLNLIIYLPPDDQNLYRCLGGCSFSLIWNATSSSSLGWDPPNGPLYSLTAAAPLTSVIYWSLHVARCAAVYCNLQQCRAYSHFQTSAECLNDFITETQPSWLCLLSYVQFRKSVFLVYLYLVTML